MLSVVVNVYICGREGGKGVGIEQGEKWDSWLWARGQQVRNFAALYKEPPFQVRGWSFHIRKHHICNE
jgi:hypothetical protein